jgi:hypothetical protein
MASASGLADDGAGVLESGEAFTITQADRLIGGQSRIEAETNVIFDSC